MKKKDLNQIDCGAATEWIHLLLDRELPEASREKLEAHLETCENCRTVYRQLRLVEEAHSDLDGRLENVPANYFDDLPGRVMARIAAAQPKAAKKPVAASPRLLPWLEQILWGRGKYALALATVAMIAFVITRQLQETSPTAGVLTSPSQESFATFKSDSSTPEPSDAQPRPQIMTSEVPSQSLPAATPPLEQVTKPPEVKLQQEPSAGETDVSTTQIQTGVVPPVPYQAPAMPEKISSEDISQPKSMPAGEVSEGNQEVTNQNVGATQESLTKTEARAVPEAGRSREPAPVSKAAMRTAAFESSPLPPAGARFAQTLQRAQATSDETARQKIWRDFLATNTDSAYHGLAAEQLARSFSASIDSASSTRQIKEAAEFYQAMETALKPQMGAEAFMKEKARLYELLKWKEAERK